MTDFEYWTRCIKERYGEPSYISKEGKDIINAYWIDSDFRSHNLKGPAKIYVGCTSGVILYEYAIMGKKVNVTNLFHNFLQWSKSIGPI